MQNSFVSSLKRIKVYNIILATVVAVFGFRLFYLQIIKYDFYQQQAEASQLKQFEIPAERGGIYAYDSGEIVPLVLNEIRYRIVADPEIIDDSDNTAQELSKVLNIPADKIKSQIQENSRYEILANKQTKEVKQAVEDLKLPGIFTNEKVPLRVYIQGPIAAQTLGFVNDAGEGNYGVEQFLDGKLKGTPGRVRALTDQNNVPLLATDDNVLTDAENGDNIVLTIDAAMQKQVEKILEQGLKNAISDSGSVIVIDPNSGAVKAMATYPSYDPAKFSEVKDLALFTNTAVSVPLEPGSIMKTLTASAALNTNSVTPTQTYFDPSLYQIDDAVVSNIVEQRGAATRSVSDILQFSLNTGATWLLMQMGDGEINEKGRKVWHDYMVNHFMFGRKTGIEQGHVDTEAAGIVPDPVDGYGLNIRYANTAFGQGMTVTPIQMAAAVSSVVNGGTYYQPTLVSGTVDSEGNLTKKEPVVVSKEVVSQDVSKLIISFMNNIINNNNTPAVRGGYQVGGKSGTAEIANPAGGYFEDIYNGTYVGYVGGDKPEYVIMVRVDKPKIPGYAGSKAAGPIFTSTSNMLIDNFTVSRINN